jgi:hypothetical protein
MRRVLLVVVMALGLPGTAQAGTFEVGGCHPALDGRSLFTYEANTAKSAGAASASFCQGRDEVAVVANGGRADTGHFNAIVARTPPGFAFAGFRAGRLLMDNKSNMDQYLRTDAGTIRYPCPQMTLCDFAPYDLPFGPTGQFDMIWQCGPPPSGGSPVDRCQYFGQVRFFGPSFTVRHDGPPGLDAVRLPPQGSLALPGAVAAATGTVNGGPGVRAVEVRLKGTRVARSERPCTAWGFEPCGTAPLRLEHALTREALRAAGEGTHRLEVVATDGAGNGAARGADVRVDLTPPGAPLSAAVTRPGWIRDAAVPVKLVAPQADPGAPVAAVRASVGPAPDGATSTSAPLSPAATGEVPVPGDGEQNVWLWFEDAMGSHDPATALPVTVRLDRSAPTVSAISADRGGVRLEVRDPHSGLASATVRIDRRRKAVKVVGGRASTSIAPGRRRVEVVATDQVGNVLRRVYRVRVRGVTLSVNDRRLRVGQAVRFTGSCTGRGRVELQARQGGRWVTFRRASCRSGRFARTYRFRRSRGTYTYRFRAIQGTRVSAQTRVTVRG